MSWGLVSFTTDGAAALGVLRADGAVVTPPELTQWSTMLELFDDWSSAEPIVRTLDVDTAPMVAADGVLAPIRWPRKVLCAGVNYKRHIREMGGEVPTEGWTPFFFLKPPTTTVIGPHDAIVLHGAGSYRYDWEAELAVVIGTRGRDIEVADALSFVAGYCVANDISARGRHKRTAVPADAFVYDWFASKAMDTSLPMGPGITPAFQISDPQDLHIQLWVNDVLHQDESTSDMICPVAELISAASQTVTLETGDVLLTGTPSGVGAGRGLSLAPGDVVRTSIARLGTLENKVVAG